METGNQEYFTNEIKWLREKGIEQKQKIEGLEKEIKTGAIVNECFLHQIAKLEQFKQEALKVIEFYAEPENWSRSDGTKYDVIEHDDCADYPHFTRDVKETGGMRAREFLNNHHKII